MSSMQRIVLTPGEPAGIGPDVVLQAAQKNWPCELLVIADPMLLAERARHLNLEIHIQECDLASLKKHKANCLQVLPVYLKEKAIPGKLNIHNAHYVIETLQIATQFCLNHETHGLVTGPVHKEIINQANIPFTGHTEFLANMSKVKQTLMLFVIDDLKITLATTHLPLREVPDKITSLHLKNVITLLRNDLKKWFKLENPTIAICGLNPHAGEGGYLGHEEIEIMTPLIQELNRNHFNLVGPLSADTIFTRPQLKKYDAILAMYHDQALPVVKHMGFDRAVNVTLGLPFIRTSVDHGTALDLAGSGNALSSSLEAALNLAIRLTST